MYVGPSSFIVTIADSACQLRVSREFLFKRTLQREWKKLMGADEKDPAPMTEPLVDIFPNVKKPTFKFLEEGTSFTEKVCRFSQLFPNTFDYNHSLHLRRMPLQL